MEDEFASKPLSDCRDNGEPQSTAAGTGITTFEAGRQAAKSFGNHGGSIIRDSQRASGRKRHLHRPITRAVTKCVVYEVAAQDTHRVRVEIRHHRAGG